MMSIKGLQPGEMVLPKTFLKAGASVYFSSIVLSMWDNIHGPKVLQVWQGPGQLQGKLKQPPEPDKEPERVNNLAQGPADEKLGLATGRCILRLFLFILIFIHTIDVRPIKNVVL